MTVFAPAPEYRYSGADARDRIGRQGSRMNTPSPQNGFAAAGAHKARVTRSAQLPLRSRLSAIAVTALAHIVVIFALVEGLRQANIIHPPEIVTVHIEVQKKKPEDLPLPLPAPALIKPSLITAPVPLINIAPPPSPLIAVAPSTATPPAPTAPQAATGTSHAALNWQGQLLARLEQAKRYPQSAQMRQQQGMVMLHFTMDRDGNVLASNIQKSSGYDALDQETLALLQRAQPLPKPPADVTGNPIDLVVPVEFYLNRRF